MNTERSGAASGVTGRSAGAGWSEQIRRGRLAEQMRRGEHAMNTHLRVGDAERDEAVSALHEHFAQGRLSREELDERLTAALRARTVGDLRKVTSDLPSPPEAGRAPHWPDSRPGRYGLPMTGFAYRRRPPFGLFLVPLFLVAVFAGGWVLFPLAGLVFFVCLIGRHAHARR